MASSENLHHVKMNIELSPEMSLLLTKMTEQLNLQTSTITENITAAILKQVDEKIKPIMAENEKLRNDMEVLNKKILNLEMNNRKNNIIIHGLPEANQEKYEDLSTLVTSTLKDIEIKIETNEIERQRIGKKGDKDSKRRPILLATTTLQKKIEILRNKTKMKPNTYITHDLPKHKLLAKKGNQETNVEKKETKKRKRSQTPSPQTSNQISICSKMHKKDAFQHLRARSNSLPGNNNRKN